MGQWITICQELCRHGQQRWLMLCGPDPATASAPAETTNTVKNHARSEGNGRQRPEERGRSGHRGQPQQRQQHQGVPSRPLTYTALFLRSQWCRHRAVHLLNRCHDSAKHNKYCAHHLKQHPTAMTCASSSPASVPTAPCRSDGP